MIASPPDGTAQGEFARPSRRRAPDRRATTRSCTRLRPGSTYDGASLSTFELIRCDPPSDALAAWNVIVDEAVVGRLEKRAQIGRNLTPSYEHSGVRHVELWEATVSDAALSPEERAAVEDHITRPKRTRDTAAKHLLDAYVSAGVDLPVASADD